MLPSIFPDAAIAARMPVDDARKRWLSPSCLVFNVARFPQYSPLAFRSWLDPLPLHLFTGMVQCEHESRLSLFSRRHSPESVAICRPPMVTGPVGNSCMR